MSAPLPTITDDASIHGAQQATADYTAAIAAVRANNTLSALAKARAIAAEYQAVKARFADLWDNLQSRRLARLQHLKSGLPIGPGVPDTATPAERVVIESAFRSALDRVRQSSPDQLDGLLSDAVRYGDETLRRAVITAAIAENRSGRIASQLARSYPDLAATLTEAAQVQAQLDGTDTLTAGWERKAFWPIPTPDEVRSLPMLEHADARAR
jgi:hypothetical protein